MKSTTVPPRTIDPFAASLPRDLLAGFPRYSRSRTFFPRFGCGMAPKLPQESSPRLNLGKERTRFYFGSSTSNGKIAPKNIN